jgi:hypothetical protein
MNKNTLKIIIYILITIIILFLLYNIYYFDVKINNIENFDIDENMIKYNLISIKSMDTNNNIYSITLPDMKFIKTIFIECIDEKNDETDSIKKNDIPLDLEIIIKDENNIDRYVNMDKYKLSGLTDQIYYSDKKKIFFDILDNKNELLYGKTIILKSNIYKFKFNKILIYGNDNGNDYSKLFGEIDITTEIDKQTFDCVKPYLISKIEFNLVEEEDVNEYKSIIEVSGDEFNKQYNIILDSYHKTYYFTEPLLVFNNLLTYNITNTNTTINNIYGKVANSTEIQNFKFLNGIITYRDSLNPDTILGDKQIEEKIEKGIEVLDVLNYQEKINKQLKQLDVHKFNIRELYNQKLDIKNTISKIDRISNNYIKLIKDTDSHNANKFVETINLLQYLKSQLEQQERLEKVNFNINFKI